MGIIDLIIAKVKDPDVKEEVVKKLNASVNIPIISEKTEASIISSIYDIFIDCICKALRK